MYTIGTKLSVRITEVVVSFGPSELSVIERCLYYRGVRLERLDCASNFVIDTVYATPNSKTTYVTPH